MADISCKACYRQYSSELEECPHCGHNPNAGATFPLPLQEFNLSQDEVMNTLLDLKKCKLLEILICYIGMTVVLIFASNKYVNDLYLKIATSITIILFFIPVSIYAKYRIKYIKSQYYRRVNKSIPHRSLIISACMYFWFLAIISSGLIGFHKLVLNDSVYILISLLLSALFLYIHIRYYLYFSKSVSKYLRSR